MQSMGVYALYLGTCCLSVSLSCLPCVCSKTRCQAKILTVLMCEVMNTPSITSPHPLEITICWEHALMSLLGEEHEPSEPGHHVWVWESWAQRICNQRWWQNWLALERGGERKRECFEEEDLWTKEMTRKKFLCERPLVSLYTIYNQDCKKKTISQYLVSWLSWGLCDTQKWRDT